MNPELRDTPSAHQPPPGAGFMNAVRWTLFAGLLVLALASVTSYVAWRVGEGRAGAHAALYHCPMHPTYTSDRPGDCPICGMDLVPVSRDAHAAGDGDVPGLAGVTLTPDRIQLIGVRTAVAAPRALGAAVEVTGAVVPDESRLSRVQLRVAGWVQALHVSRTGERVRAGQPLLEIYSPELFQSESEYLIERRARAAMPAMAHDEEGAAAVRQRLTLLGVPDEELARLEREGTASTRLTLRAPASGTVLERGVVEGQYVGADTPLLTLADLSRVWVLADLYPGDLARVRAGDAATFTTDAVPGRVFDSRVEFVYPTAEGDAHTVKARLALDARDGELRPGLFGRVTIRTRARTALAVPGEAVVRAGERDYVFLARAGGRFEPRAVTAGTADGEWLEIVRGLAAGDTVVASASFLIDSESRLRAAIEGAGAAAPATAPPPAHGAAR
jgi:membrane fusion protein, copper/silver efflux system